MRARRVGIHVRNAGDPIFLSQVHQPHQLEFVRDVSLGFTLHKISLTFAFSDFQVSFLAVNEIKKLLHI
jgi:hypothetical protein